MKFGETQPDFYGKRGMPLLGVAMYWRDHSTGSIRVHYFDIILDNDGEQDVHTSVSILDSLFQHIKNRYPELQKLSLISDNGSHFASYDFVYFVARQSIAMRDVRIICHVFSEACWGKSG